MIDAVRYGRSVLAGGGRGAGRGRAGAGGIASARRGCPGAGGAADVFGLDGVWGRRGLGATLAGVVRAQQCGSAALELGAWPLARAAASPRTQDLGRAGARPAELDFAAAARRGRGAHESAPAAIAPGRATAEGSFRWRRPRHALTGRQDRAAVERVGLRLHLRRAQARGRECGATVAVRRRERGPTHPYLAHVWAARGADLGV